MKYEKPEVTVVDFAAMERLATLPDGCRILAGHEGESTLGHEKKTNPFMV